ncbi:hypothetical protein SAMD00019534_116820, partial [Acytostelium subglobosum LB1]|uniref:hypothetical protein n=1 Tax=Acytostelium subglobosum LB1 TaxID=1410327 RepID=UPI000644A3C2
MPTYSSSTTGDYLVIVFLSIRFTILFILFILNGTQTILEWRYLKKHNRSINPRLMTFLSISLFPLFRGLEQLTYLLVYPRVGYGSVSLFLGAYGTYFEFTEWIFIGCFWMQLLYTFFVSNSVIMKNSQRVWYSSCALAIALLIYTIVTSIFYYVNPSVLASWETFGMIAWIVLVGVSIAFNGMALVRFMKRQEKRIPKLEHTIRNTSRLAATLIVIVICMLSIMIGFAVANVPKWSDYIYVSRLLISIIEISQLVIVMKALSGDTPINYLHFKRVNEDSYPSYSSSNMSKSGGDDQYTSGVGNSNNPACISVSMGEATSSNSIMMQELSNSPKSESSDVEAPPPSIVATCGGGGEGLQELHHQQQQLQQQCQQQQQEQKPQCQLQELSECSEQPTVNIQCHQHLQATIIDINIGGPLHHSDGSQ